MTLLKTSLLSAISVVIKMIAMLGINKVLAIYVGPAGYAAIGQFQNAVQMITTFASGAINTGVTRYTAEYGDEPDQQILVWRTAGTIAFLGSIVAAALISLFSSQLANIFLNDESLSSVFIWFALTLVLFVFNSLLLAILNGKKEIRKFVAANIAGSLFALIVTVAMVIQFGLYGALVSLGIYQSLNFFVTFYMVYKTDWFKISFFWGGVDKVIAKNLFKYTLMALTSALCVPISLMLIRDLLASTYGLEAAGYWEAMWRLSGAYLMFVTTTLAVYYLPKLSELREPAEIRKEIFQGYKLILPLVSLLCILIYVFREIIINLLFSSEFIRMEVLFSWQLLGDFVKVASWLLGYLLAAKALVVPFILTEVVFSFLFYILVRLLIGTFGFEAVAISHCINYVLHFITMYIILRAYKII